MDHRSQSCRALLEDMAQDVCPCFPETMNWNSCFFLIVFGVFFRNHVLFVFMVSKYVWHDLASCFFVFECCIFFALCFVSDFCVFDAAPKIVTESCFFVF